MASKYWIKLYHEILDDPKMGLLPDHLWRRTIELFLLAGEYHNAGSLPPVEWMSWKLRTSTDELEKELAELAYHGILDVDNETGFWIVTNFSKRQEPVSNAERVKRHRDAKRSCNVLSNENVTKAVIDTDIEEDTDQNKDAAVAAPSTFPEWQKRLRETTNQVPIILAMCEKLYPDNEKPTGGHVAGAAKAVGGYGRLADLLWQHSSRPPTGNPIQFVQGVAKGNRRRETGPDGRKLDVDGQPIREWRDVRVQMKEEEKETHADG